MTRIARSPSGPNPRSCAATGSSGGGAAHASSGSAGTCSGKFGTSFVMPCFKIRRVSRERNELPGKEPTAKEWARSALKAGVFSTRSTHFAPALEEASPAGGHDQPKCFVGPRLLRRVRIGCSWGGILFSFGSGEKEGAAKHFRPSVYLTDSGQAARFWNHSAILWLVGEERKCMWEFR